jgi:hypothetical protein
VQTAVIKVPSNFFTAARPCCCSEQKNFTRRDDRAALQKFFFVMCLERIFTMKIEKFQQRGKIQCARQHFSYCAAAHTRSLEGTLGVL